MDRILFGDNQFFGVNHASEEKARAQAMKFRDSRSMIGVLDLAYDAGIRTFMCTTHSEVGQIADHVARHPGDYEGLVFYPGMPYAHKYANALSELGLMETMRQFAPGGMVSTMMSGARSVLRKDIDDLMRMLVEAEMRPFERVSCPVIFLQNVVTDLLSGLGIPQLFASYAELIRTRYGAEPGFITMNMPRLVDQLESVGIVNPIVCCNYNSAAFRTSGGIELLDETLRTKQVRCIAMSVLASGALSPAAALKWVCDRPGIESIVFGASSRGNIESTVSMIREFDQARDQPAPATLP